MKDKYFIGVDSGSQSTKVFIFNQIGDVICSASEPLKAMMVRKPGYFEHPDDDLWDSLKIVLNRVMKNFNGDIKSILGLGLCSIRCCRVFMKQDGTLAEPVMSWMDVRSYAKYEDSDHIAYTSPTSGYITHRLTGLFKDTSANAFQWQFPLDMDTWTWSEDPDYFNSFNIPAEKLLDLDHPGEILGYVSKKASDETGLPEGLPVVATANDKAVEALGSGIVSNDKGFISLGTYIAAMVCGSENEKNPKNYWVNLACMPFKYLYESNGIRKGMGHISWFRDFLGEEFLRVTSDSTAPAEEILSSEASQVPVGSDGLFTIPDWLAPASQLYRKGVILGFESIHTRAHVFRSIMEGIALTLKSNYESMVDELGIKPGRVVISGGGSNSDLFMQIFADVLGVTTVRNQINGAAALGAAICVAVASGVYKDFNEAVKHMVKVKDEFYVDEQSHMHYNEIYSKYIKIPGMLENTLKELYECK